MTRSRDISALLGSTGTITASVLDASVSEALGGGTDTYDSVATLPLTGNDAGDQAFVSENNRLYLWNGSGWYNIALINTAPSITGGGAGSYELAIDGTPTVITLTATDPEGLPITWSYSVTSGSLGSTATVSQVDNVFTITPSTSTSDQGEFTITFTASDGVNIATDVNSFSLNFLSALWSEVALSIGTSSTNSLNNSTFVDRSTNAHTVTPSGSPVQTAFNPYLDTWSTYFDGSTRAYLNNNPFQITTGEFTIEAWIKAPINRSETKMIIENTNWNTGDNGGWRAQVNADGTIGINASVGVWNDFPAITASTQTINEGEWNHIAFVRNASNEVSIYINGVQDTASIVTHATSLNLFGDNDGTLETLYSRIGYHGADGGVYNVFSGYMSTIRVSTVCRYTSTFDPLSADYSADANTKCLLLHTSDASFTEGTSSEVPVWTGTPVTRGGYDLSEYTSSTNYGSVYLDNNSYITVPTNITISNTATISCWVNPNQISSSEDPIFKFYDGSSPVEFRQTSNDLNVAVGSNWTHTVQDVFRVGEWVHIAVTKNGTNSNLFVNGILVSSSTSATNGIISFAGPNRIGANQTNSYYFHGTISDFKISTTEDYTTNFTPPTAPVGNTNAELYLPMDNAGIFDKTGNNTLTLGGNAATSTTQTKFADTSMYFDGTGDYISVNDFPPIGSGDYTMEFWMNGSSVDASGTWQSLLSRDYANTDGFRLYKKDAAAELVFYNGSTATATTVSAGLTNNTWHHIAVVRNSGTLDIYVDGVSKVSVSNSTNISEAVQPINIGGNTGEASSYPFTGYLENVQILIGVAKYTTNFTSPTRTQGRTFQAES